MDLCPLPNTDQRGYISLSLAGWRFEMPNMHVCMVSARQVSVPSSGAEFVQIQDDCLGS